MLTCYNYIIVNIILQQSVIRINYYCSEYLPAREKRQLVWKDCRYHENCPRNSGLLLVSYIHKFLVTIHNFTDKKKNRILLKRWKKRSPTWNHNCYYNILLLHSAEFCNPFFKPLHQRHRIDFWRFFSYFFLIVNKLVPDA